MKFKVGDRVRAIGDVCGINLKGKCGTVIMACGTVVSYDVAVEFDERVRGGHNCLRQGKDGHCRFGYESEFELITHEQKLVITTDGKETLARLYENNKVVKSATAKCSPDDTFDFKVGAKLAFDRLVGIEKAIKEPKYFKGKAVCIKSCSRNLTVGKIYDFSVNDGRGKSEAGVNILSYPCESVGELNERLFGDVEFLEIKE